MKSFILVGAAISTITRVRSHMILAYPPSLRYEGNPYVQPASIDYSLSSPLNADGSNFPCKGYQTDLGTEAGSSVATWVSGNSYNFTLIGSATHHGGSCQASLSYDKGATFTTVYSYIGGCPAISPPGGSFNFTIPSDAPIGAALFAWTWFNEVGNREMYMNCASVTIDAGPGGRKRARSLAFTSRPSIFVANLQNGCSTTENTDISFPDPGPDVTDISSHPGEISGTCRMIAGIGSFGNSGSSTATQASRLSTSGLFDASNVQYPSQFINISASYLSTSDSTGSQATTATGISNTVESKSMVASSTTTLSHGGVKFTDSQPSYLFNPQSTENIAVYFGQTPVTNGTSLAAQCADSNIDIVILAFVISQTYSGPYPEVNFGAACGGQTTTMVSEALGLLYCPDLAADIATCQSTYGKKVLLSVGGAVSQIVFTSATQASAFADILWKLFGPPGNIDINLRPFGNISVDGFDIGNEDNDPANYQVLGNTLRTHFSSYGSKTFFLSSAPQCHFLDASNPLDLLLICDFVWVQFYNNLSCEIGSSGFDKFVKQWSQALLNSTISPSPRLFLGSPAWSAAGSTAYGNIGTPEGIEHVASNVKQMNLQNFGGVMFWDGPEGMLNVEGGKSIIGWAKAGLAVQN